MGGQPVAYCLLGAGNILNKEGAIVSKVENGKLVDEKVLQKNFPKIEKGKLIKINSIIVHQTGSSAADQTFNSYKTGGHGTHFLIDKKSVIYQTANLSKKTYHVGKIKSKCY